MLYVILKGRFVLADITTDVGRVSVDLSYPRARFTSGPPPLSPPHVSRCAARGRTLSLCVSHIFTYSQSAIHLLCARSAETIAPSPTSSADFFTSC